MDNKDTQQPIKAIKFLKPPDDHGKCWRLWWLNLNRFIAKAICCVLVTSASSYFARSQIDRDDQLSASPHPRIPASSPEYLWYEAENMRGISKTSRHEALLNPSYLELAASRAPGWGINGPGVSAEWSQGGESEWNSVTASADETRARIWQDLEVPRAGEYKVWVRYADWGNRTENFSVRLEQENREVFRHEFGAKDVIDPHDETSMYWQWVFAWDGAVATLAKGPARISIEIEKAAQAVRQVDCVVITNDLRYTTDGRRKPDLAAMRYLRELSSARTPLAPLIETPARIEAAPAWQRPKLAGRDFQMPCNIPKEFCALHDN